MTRKHHKQRSDSALRQVTERRTASPFEPADTTASRRPVIFGAVLTAFAAFLAYVRTLAPGMHFGDGMELSAAARVLGVPHPTGYPFYMLLLHGFTWLPVGEVATRTALASAVAVAACAGLTTVILNDLLGAAIPRIQPKTALIVASCGSLTCAFLRLAWDNAVVTEVYGLHLLLMLVLVRAVQWQASGRCAQAMITGALATGIGLAHHRLALMALPILAGLVWSALRRQPHGLRRHATIAVLGLMAPLSFYAYLPWRAASRPPINWGNPVSLSAFLDHVRGKGYVEYRLLQAVPGQTFDPASYARFLRLVGWQTAGAFLDQVVPVAMTGVSDFAFHRSFPLPRSHSIPPRHGMWTQPLSGGIEQSFGVLLLLAIGLTGAGTVMVLRTAPLPGAAALALAGFHLAMIFLYNIADIGDYCLVPFWLAWAAAWIGLIWLGSLVLQRLRLAGILRPEWGYALIAVPIAVGAGNFARCDRSRDTHAEEFSYFILPQSREMMPEGSVLMTAGDADTFTCWYRQVVRGERRDVLVFGSNFVHRPWYATFFSDQQIADYRLKFAAEVPHGAESFARQLREGLLDANVGRVPVFTTLEDPLVLQELSRHYTVRPVAAKGVKGLLPATAESTVTLLRLEPLETPASGP